MKVPSSRIVATIMRETSLNGLQPTTKDDDMADIFDVTTFSQATMDSSSDNIDIKNVNLKCSSRWIHKPIFSWQVADDYRYTDILSSAQVAETISGINCQDQMYKILSGVELLFRWEAFRCRAEH